MLKILVYCFGYISVERAYDNSMRYIFLAVGAILGALSRYFLSGWLNTSGFPYGTLIVNVSGCLVIGIFGTLAAEKLIIDPNIKIAVQTGFLGSYTTFSSFGYETLRFLDEKNLKMAVLSFIGNNTLGLAAVWAGITVARMFTTAR